MKKSFIENRSSNVMKKIDNKEHEDLIKVFEHYKKYYDIYGNVTITEYDDEIIRKNVIELQGTYDYYQVLLSELKKCTHNYRTRSVMLRTKMSVPVKKMRTMFNKKEK